MKNLLNILRNQEVYQLATQAVHSLNYELTGESARQASDGVKHPVMARIAAKLEGESDVRLAREGESDYVIHLRVASAADIAAITALEREGYEGYLAWEQEDFERDWRTNPYAVYLLLEHRSVNDDDSPLVGMVTGRFLAKKAHVSHLIVHPDFQGLGLGDYLLSHWLTFAKEEKIRQASLEVRESNFAAQMLYKKHGFTVSAKKYNYYYNNNETALLMVRPLNKG